MNAETPNGTWIGPRPSNLEVFAIMFVGVSGIMMAGVGPFLLENLAHEGRITPAQIGQAVSAELLTLGIAAFLAGAVFKPARLKLMAIITSLMLAALNAITPFYEGDTVTLIRGIAGLPSGVLMWVTIAFIARTPSPERWSGAYLTVQTLAQLLMAALVGGIMVQSGASTGWMVLSGFCVATAFFAVFVPSQLASLPRTEGHGALPGARGWIALLSTFLYSGFTICIWAFTPPLAKQAGLDTALIGTAVSISLACQVGGGLAATLLAGRINWLWTVAASALLAAGVMYGYYMLPSPEMFLILSGAFGFLWLFVLPFLVPMVIEADPTRRAAVLIGGAQVLGGSFAPFVASMLVTETDSRSAIVFGGACMIAAVLLAFGLHQIRPRIRTEQAALEGGG